MAVGLPDGVALRRERCVLTGELKVLEYVTCDLGLSLCVLRVGLPHGKFLRMSLAYFVECVSGVSLSRSLTRTFA